MNPIGLRTAAALLCIAGAACSHSRGGGAMGAAAATPERGAADWRPLFDATLSGWRGYRQQSLPAGWRVVDGIVTKDGEVEDLVTREQFGDFELAFDWRLASGGNSGVFYRATEEYDHVYWSGPEYQLLDDAGHPDGRNRLTSAGAAYGLYPPPSGVVKPAGSWNSSRIVVVGSHVEHWLNGQRVVEYELGSADWQARVAASKFHEWPGYGRARRGLVAIQGDHAGRLDMRDMRIRVLP
jgi:hypothetical protein